MSGEGTTARCLLDQRRTQDPDGFWVGYSVSPLGSAELMGSAAKVVAFDWASGALTLDSDLANVAPGTPYELFSDEEAPVLAVRYLMGLRLGERIGPIDIRLGTTRATNALLERSGGKVALVTTRGFGDVLKIGYQDRPSLFAPEHPQAR